MPTYKELLAQRQQLDDAIAQARKHELSDAVMQAKALIEEFALTSKDVFGSARKSRGSADGKVAPKYRDPESGTTWTGRGRQPRWLDGKKIEDYLIERP